MIKLELAGVQGCGMDRARSHSNMFLCSLVMLIISVVFFLYCFTLDV